jgi:hypothetical protein
MADFLALLRTVPGEVTLAVFAKHARMTEAQMRAELLANAPLARYFLTMVKKAMDEVPA